VPSRLRTLAGICRSGVVIRLRKRLLSLGILRVSFGMSD
jgi:hypothetical protein